MVETPKDDPSRYPPLGRALMWVDKPGSANKLFWGLAIFGVVLFALEFTYKKYGEFMVQEIPGFFGVYGFVMFSLLILAAKGLRVLIKRPENYYGDKTIDTESYPEDQLERLDHDA